jgi:hypothetical protein
MLLELSAASDRRRTDGHQTQRTFAEQADELPRSVRSSASAACGSMLFAKKASTASLRGVRAPWLLAVARASCSMNGAHTKTDRTMRSSAAQDQRLGGARHLDEQQA